MQMPPVLKIRNEEAPVISEDSEINQFETDGTKYVFTDITFGIPVKVNMNFKNYDIFSVVEVGSYCILVKRPSSIDSKLCNLVYNFNLRCKMTFFYDIRL